MNPILQGLIGFVFLMVVLGVIFLVNEAGNQRAYRKRVAAEEDLAEHADEAIDLAGGLR